MTATKITENEIQHLKVASLPTYPTSPRAYGGKGYTATEMKAAFDKLPLFIIERFNALLDDIAKEGEGSLAECVKTGIKDSHTLAELFEDVRSGELASYLTVGDTTLLTLVSQFKVGTIELDSRIKALEDYIELITEGFKEVNSVMSSFEERLNGLDARLSALEGKEEVSDEQN